MHTLFSNKTPPKPGESGNVHSSCAIALAQVISLILLVVTTRFERNGGERVSFETHNRKPQEVLFSDCSATGTANG
jgi:hypothetical protein